MPAQLPGHGLSRCAGNRRFPEEGEPRGARLPGKAGSASGDDLGHDAGTDGAAALADGEAHALLDGDRADQLGAHLDAVAGHHHLHVGAVVGGEGGDLAGHVGGADVELRAVAGEEGGVTAAFLLLEHVDLTFELGVGLDGVGLHQHHAALDVLLLDAPEQQTHVVAGHALVEQLAEHLHTGDGGFAGVLDAHDLDGFADLHLAALDPSGGDRAPAGDREDVLDGHQEGLVDLTLGLGDGLVDGIHQIEDLVDPLVLTAHGLLPALDILEGLQGGTGDHGDVVAGEVVAAQQLPHLQFDQLEDLLVIDHVLLVQEHHEGRHAHLLGQQDVLLGLGHGAVGGGHHQDGTVHLGGTGDHVLDVVRVAGAVHVGVVTLVGLVLDVGRVDGDSPLFLLGGTVDLVVGLGLGHPLGGQHVGDGGSEGGLAVVNVADGADVDVRFVPLELLACHGRKESGGWVGWMKRSGIALILGNDGFRHIARNFLVVAELHRENTPTLSHGSELGGIAEHLGQRHLGLDLGLAVFDGLPFDLTTAG